MLAMTVAGVMVKRAGRRMVAARTYSVKGRPWLEKWSATPRRLPVKVSGHCVNRDGGRGHGKESGLPKRGPEIGAHRQPLPAEAADDRLNVGNDGSRRRSEDRWMLCGGPQIVSQRQAVAGEVIGHRNELAAEVEKRR